MLAWKLTTSPVFSYQFIMKISVSNSVDFGYVFDDIDLPFSVHT